MEKKPDGKFERMPSVRLPFNPLGIEEPKTPTFSQFNEPLDLTVIDTQTGNPAGNNTQLGEPGPNVREFSESAQGSGNGAPPSGRTGSA